MGRVISLFGIIGLVVMPLGYAVAGSLSLAWPTATSIVISGSIMLGTAAWLAMQRRPGASPVGHPAGG